jgi:hypothetical protein
MNTHNRLIRFTLRQMLLGALLASSALAKGVAAAPASVTGDLTLPRAVFIVPRNPEQGRDPFFPRSTRVYNTQAPAAGPGTNTVVTQVINLKLTGISGSMERKLAMINNKTFEAGEEAEVQAGGIRVRVRCLEVGADFAVVFAGGERRELRLRKGV